jgi:hypothetical protein
MAKTGLKPIDGEGSVFPSDCTHFYSICGESDTEHMVYGYILSAEEIATDDAWHAAHPPFKLGVPIAVSVIIAILGCGRPQTGGGLV